VRESSKRVTDVLRGPRQWSGLGRGLLAIACACACSPAAGGTPAPKVEAPPASDGAEGASDDGVVGLVDGSESPFVPVDESQACATEQAETVQFKEPVDIIVIVDNSASMEAELAATELNINESFANILEESAIDYRVIVLSLHRRVPRTGYGQSATMLCVQKPLSGLADCTSAAEPKFSDRFFQYSTRIGSADSFDVLLDAYEPPFDDDRHEDEFGNAPLGWSEWLRPGVKKVFLELTDGNEDMPAADFITALSQLAPEHFGADPAQPGFRFHSILDIAEKPTPTDAYQADEPIQLGTCAAEVPSPISTSGEVYQELSRLTGGLRFPICLPSAYDVVFREIAGRVVDQSDIACAFPVPVPPAGRELDLDQVAVSIAHEGATAETTLLGQARLASDCQSDAFYIQDDTIQLCPEVCSAVRGEEGARVDVLFGCESNIIVR
jgi:hypothetical protein